MNMKKVLKGIFALTMCLIIVGSSVSVSAASRSNAYMVTSCTEHNGSMTVRNDFVVDSMKGKMVLYWRDSFDGFTYYNIQEKTTNRTRSCNLSYTTNKFQIISHVDFEGRIEGSVVGSWRLYR